MQSFLNSVTKKITPRSIENPPPLKVGPNLIQKLKELVSSIPSLHKKCTLRELIYNFKFVKSWSKIDPVLFLNQIWSNFLTKLNSNQIFELFNFCKIYWNLSFCVFVESISIFLFFKFSKNTYMKNRVE